MFDRLRIEKTLNIDDVRAPFLIELEHIRLKVALGLNAIERAEPEDSVLLASVKFQPAADFAPSIEATKQEFKSWIIANGLRDCAEALHAHLEIVFSHCLLVKLCSATGSVASEHLADEYELPRRNFHSANLPRKIAIITEQFGIPFRSDNQRCLRSLNRVRNCLSHRGGIVRELDCNRDGRLIVEWCEWVFIREDGSEIEIGKPVGAGGAVFMRKGLRKRVFNVGDCIDFSAQEFSGFLMSYSFLVEETAAKVMEYARSSGIHFTSP